MLRLRIPRGSAWFARVGLNILMVVSAAGGLLGLIFVLMGLFDHTIKFRDAMEATGLGILLMGICWFALVLRSRWYRTRGIFVSWPCFLEAVAGAIGRPRITRQEIDALVKYSNQRQDPSAPLANLYHVAHSRRWRDPESELEFMWVADVLYKYASNVQQISQHTILHQYTPARYRVGMVFGWVWAVLGICGGVGGLVVPGPSPATRVILAAGGLWGLSVGVGLVRRWRWAFIQGFLFLIAAEAGSVYLATTRRADDLAPVVVLGIYVPLFMGLYLYRRRGWFSGGTPD